MHKESVIDADCGNPDVCVQAAIAAYEAATLNQETEKEDTDVAVTDGSDATREEKEAAVKAMGAATVKSKVVMGCLRVCECGDN